MHSKPAHLSDMHMEQSQHFQLHVLKTTMRVPARSSDEAPDAKSTINRKAEFERKPGMLSRLKGQFEQLKAAMKEGRTRARSTLAETRLSGRSLDSFVSSIRRNSVGLRLPSHSRGKSVGHTDQLLIRPDPDRHARVLSAIKNNKNSCFLEMDQLQKKQLIAALDACSGLSGEEIVAPEGLFYLKDAIDKLIENSDNTAYHSSSSEKLLSTDLNWIRLDCKKRLEDFCAQENNAQSDTARTASTSPPALDDILLELGEAKAPTTPSVSTHAKASERQKADPPSLDDILIELGAANTQPGPMSSGVTAGQTDPEIAIQAELDALLREAEAVSAQSKPVLNSAQTANKNISVEKCVPDAAQPATSGKKNTSTSEARTAVDPSIGEFDELDALAMELKKSADRAAPGTVINDDEAMAELADLDQLAQEIAQSLQSEIDPARSNAEQGAKSNATGKSGLSPESQG